MGKITIKIATQMRGQSLNYIFVCLKNHKGSIIVWVVLGIFSINYEIYMLKV
jgi:hypothetical protein